MTEDYWKEQGVEFRVIEEDQIPAVLDFLRDNFFPDEPISRSLGIKGDEWIVRNVYTDHLMDKSSIAAVDGEGKILGVRIGHVVHKSHYFPWIIHKMLQSSDWYSFLLPTTFFLVSKILNYLEFSSYGMFTKLNCETIFEDGAVCSGRFHGIKGLGTELVRRSDVLAKERGCSYTYALVTGNYSAKIFDREGHTLLKALVYSDFKDSSGELYLKDTREHVQCSVYLKAL